MTNPPRADPAKFAKPTKRGAPTPTGLSRGTRRLLVCGLAIAAAGGGVYGLWSKFGPRVLHSDHYRLAADQIVITERPPWIHADVKAEVFRDASLDEPTWIHDADLAERMAKAFALHPWVASVERVVKQAPNRIVVDLAYRRPVCMVEVPGGVFPVDAEGVLLPRDDFTPADARKYPRLAAIHTLPAGQVGMPWGDLHVSGGAEVAAALAEAWDELRLERIEPASATSPDVQYVVFGRPAPDRGATRVLWGHAPSQQQPGEATAAEKVARLKQYVANHGPLEAREAPPELDLRSAQTAQQDEAGARVQ